MPDLPPQAVLCPDHQIWAVYFIRELQVSMKRVQKILLFRLPRALPFLTANHAQRNQAAPFSGFPAGRSAAEPVPARCMGEDFCLCSGENSAAADRTVCLVGCLGEILRNESAQDRVRSSERPVRRCNIFPYLFRGQLCLRGPHRRDTGAECNRVPVGREKAAVQDDRRGRTNPRAAQDPKAFLGMAAPKLPGRHPSRT